MKTEDNAVAETVARMRRTMEEASVGAVPGGDYIGALINAAPTLISLAEEALRRREVFGLAKLACQRSEVQGAHFYLVDLDTMEALIAAVKDAS
jgi:hypothetical protein